MRVPRKLLPRRFVSIGGVIGLAALLAGPPGVAAADPVGLPLPPDIVGVGSDTSEGLFDQLSAEYNGHPSPPLQRRLYSYQATGPSPIRPKALCDKIERPNGTSPARAAMLNRQVLPTGAPCLDFYRSIAGRLPGDPANMVYAPFALDSLTWAANEVSNAPAALTLAQLKAIIECTATTWDQVGGTSTDTIQLFLPTDGPGLRAFIQRVGGATPGPCAHFGLQADVGTIPELVGNPNAVLFYAVGKYLAQTEYHHDDVHGTIRLGVIDGASPTVVNPSTGRTEINVGQAPGVAPFPSNFYFLESVGMFADAVTGALDPDLANLFVGSAAWICTAAGARVAIADFGLLNLPPSLCGQRQ